MKRMMERGFAILLAAMMMVTSVDAGAVVYAAELNGQGTEQEQTLAETPEQETEKTATEIPGQGSNDEISLEDKDREISHEETALQEEMAEAEEKKDEEQLSVDETDLHMTEADEGEGGTEETYTVTFNTNGGSEVAAQTVTYGEMATEPDTAPTKKGFTFAGWYIDEDFTTEFPFNTPITQDVTLYAKWEEHVHKGVLTEEKPATCMELGYKVHYRCECGEMFMDAACKEPVPEDFIYPMLEGHDEYRTDYWKYDRTDHWKTCFKCETGGMTVGKAAHDGAPCKVCGYDPAELTLKGSGTEADPYLIGSAEDLLNFGKMFRYEDTKAYFKLTDDIDLGFAEWTPIEQFSGVFDGNGKKISNITYLMHRTLPTFSYIQYNTSAFILYNNGEIRSLALDTVKYKWTGNVNNDTSGNKKGEVAGFVYENAGAITGCSFHGSLAPASEYSENYHIYFAGICYRSTGDIISCANHASIETKDHVAGIVMTIDSADIKDCQNTGNLTGREVYGIIGSVTANTDIVISGCVNSGQLIVTGSGSAYGICGGITRVREQNAPDNKISIIVEDCINSGNILATDKGNEADVVYLSGILQSCNGGRSTNTWFTLKNCKNTGDIISEDLGNDIVFNLGFVNGIIHHINNVHFTVTGCSNEGKLHGDGGGIIGDIRFSETNNWVTSVENCYNTGDIEFFTKAGGIVSSLQGGNIKKCFNTGDLNKVVQYEGNGASAVGGLVGSAGLYHYDAEITDCFNTGNISTVKTECCGGLLGEAYTLSEKTYKLSVRRCYNVGSVVNKIDPADTQMYTGAVCGYVSQGDENGKVTIQDCYYINRSVPAVGHYGPNPGDVHCTGCTLAEMLAQSTYSSWDFDTVWKMGEGQYKCPVLRGMPEPGKAVEEAADAPELTEGESGSYTVTFDSREGTAVSPVRVDVGARLTKPAEPTRKGYAFTGWFTEDATVNRWDFENRRVWEDMTLYAGWEAEDDLDAMPETGDIAAGDADTFWMAKVGTYTYTGTAIKPSVRVYAATRKLSAGTDYTVSYKNNTKAGTATVKVKGKGLYKRYGTLTATFIIMPRDMKGYLVEKTYANAYAAGSKNPALSFTAKCGKKALKKNRDYTLKVYDESGKNEVSSWKEAGTYTMKAEGKGNFTGAYSAKFFVLDKTPVSRLTVARIPAQKYADGEAVKPAPTVKLKNTILTEGTDYTLSYRNNTDIGTATLVITGKGDYFGRRLVNFSITGISMKKVKFSGFVSSLEYNNRRQEQNAVLTYQGTTLEKDRDYTIVAYENNRNAGKASVIYKGMGKYTGTVKKTFKITARSLKSLNLDTEVKLSGSFAPGRMPVLIIYDTSNERYLISGTDYTATYPNTVNSAVGSTIKITIVGKGNYKGTITKTYTVAAE